MYSKNIKLQRKHQRKQNVDSKIKNKKNYILILNSSLIYHKMSTIIYLAKAKIYFQTKKQPYTKLWAIFLYLMFDFSA